MVPVTEGTTPATFRDITSEGTSLIATHVDSRQNPFVKLCVPSQIVLVWQNKRSLVLMCSNWDGVTLFVCMGGKQQKKPDPIYLNSRQTRCNVYDWNGKDCCINWTLRKTYQAWKDKEETKPLTWNSKHEKWRINQEHKIKTQNSRWMKDRNSSCIPVKEDLGLMNGTNAFPSPMVTRWLVSELRNSKLNYKNMNFYKGGGGGGTDKWMSLKWNNSNCWTWWKKWTVGENPTHKDTPTHTYFSESEVVSPRA